MHSTEIILMNWTKTQGTLQEAFIDKERGKPLDMAYCLNLLHFFFAQTENQ